MAEAFVKYHEELKSLMVNHKNKILTTPEINRLFKSVYPELDISFMQPADHCINKTNNGACRCSMTEKAIFEYLERKKYRVL